ncbi:MAG: hypothetical protein ACJAS1_001455 [Oleiphilaceae bacterium]|jgi:hypothetical protein
MKRTALKRKTPIKANTNINAKKSFISSGTSTLKRSGFNSPQKPLKTKSTLKTHKPLKNISYKKKTEQVKTGKFIKSTFNKNTGLQGVGRTKDDIDFHSRVAALGCIACKMLGIDTVHTLRIHHIDGRNQGGDNDYSERKVLPLCDQHHRPDIAFETGGSPFDLDAPSVHGRKKKFVGMFGTETELVDKIYVMLGEKAPWKI